MPACTGRIVQAPARICHRAAYASLRASTPRQPRQKPGCKAAQTSAHRLTSSRKTRRLIFSAPLVAILAPLAPASGAGDADAPLTIEEVQARLRNCFEVDQYYVTGKIDRGIFADDCVFIDPTIKVTGVTLIRHNFKCVMTFDMTSSGNASGSATTHEGKMKNPDCLVALKCIFRNTDDTNLSDRRPCLPLLTTPRLMSKSSCKRAGRLETVLSHFNCAPHLCTSHLWTHDCSTGILWHPSLRQGWQNI
jgi:hypothetical protein